MNKLISKLILGASFIFCVKGLPSESSKSAKEIVSSGERQIRGTSSQATLTMVVQRPSYTRELYLRSWASGNEKAMVEILKPAKEEGVVSLRISQNMWNYLPKTDQVVRVPSSLMLQSWMGSDFTNDDLMKASSLSRDYSHKLLKTDSLKGQKSVLIECLPLPEAPVVWGKVLHWAREEDHLPVQQQFFDDKGKLVRTIEFSDFKQMDDRIIPAQLRIVKADNSQESTTVKYEKVIFDKTIPESIFSKEEIKTISQQGKKLNSGWYMSSLR